MAVGDESVLLARVLLPRVIRYFVYSSKRTPNQGNCLGLVFEDFLRGMFLDVYTEYNVQALYVLTVC